MVGEPVVLGAFGLGQIGDRKVVAADVEALTSFVPIAKPATH